MDRELISTIVAEVIKQLEATGNVRLPQNLNNTEDTREAVDITSKECRAKPTIDETEDMAALLRMKGETTARIGVGRAGARLKTITALTLRADHANARDAVFADVSEEFLTKLNLFKVQSCADSKQTYLTRPDLGRKISDETLGYLKQHCVMHPDVQIYIADGLSSKAVEANADKVLPILVDSLEAQGIKVGTPFFLKYGRVGSQEYIAEALGAKVVCVLLGERPGLATAESMSAYIAYNAYVGMPESKRTVVSNIHKEGTVAVEAGAYIAEVIKTILEKKASGVELVR